MSTITVTNTHGTFVADASIVDRLWLDHWNRSIEQLRAVLRETTGQAEDYSDVTRIEAFVMLAHTLPPLKPAERRYAGIRSITDYCFDKNEVPQRFTMTLGDVDDVARRIRKLSELGRAQRWRDAVESWARLVEEAKKEKTIAYFKWAVIQGSINAGHEAE